LPLPNLVLQDLLLKLQTNKQAEERTKVRKMKISTREKSKQTEGNKQRFFLGNIEIEK